MTSVSATVPQAIPGILYRRRVLVVHNGLDAASASGRATATLISALRDRDIDVLDAASANEARAQIAMHSLLQAVLIDWDLAGPKGHHGARDIISEVRGHAARMPIFLLAASGAVGEMSADVLSEVNDYVWLYEDTPDFIGGRVMAAIDRYRATLLPPMFKALANFAHRYEYSWHTPGHAGGTAFMKHPAGRAFVEFFGEELFRSDLSISVGEVGSLLDHSGPIGEAEHNAARVFGANRTYFVTNGSSTSNRVILMASVTRDQIALCDRNCHKSVEHAMTLSGAIPTYMMPSRNYLGLIGPIPPQRLDPSAVAKSIVANPLVTQDIDPAAVHAVITNSTYDGLCYDVERVESLIGQSVDRLHFDEAWYGYARFNPLYAGRFAMRGDPSATRADGPTLFATQSTHKLLAALSQASYIHIRDGRRPIAHARFNEAFMMHASTSPQYAIIASNDIAAAMMDGPSGEALTGESIGEAIAFRQTLARLRAKFEAKGEWFFSAWQPDTVDGGKGHRKTKFYLADPHHLARDPKAWVLRPGEDWHGFADLDDNYCMLDPIKVSVVTPGMGRDGKLEPMGIPAPLLAAYLDAQGIVVEKTTDFTCLFLFSMGITRGKWGTLVNALLGFRRDVMANTPLERCVPALVAAHSAAYGSIGLGDLATSMFSAMRKHRTNEFMSAAFGVLPVPVLSPVAAYEKLVNGRVEPLPLEQLAGRTVATGVVPYPPGIPLMMPGENAGEASGPLLGYLKALESFDAETPGFAHDIHGVEVVDGRYQILCITEE
ncbi:Orn/Lys/Arg decarboxylase N-terminal domain-containing protein [Variovorax sp. LG9.2]|uniref:Orn/Lys/Arg family decarboxylase n=1 Tax=Variovorax sp. LG9.2 TaxID=3048626 RepID=UPI002B22932C|nr:Orn/Lys/Arg decarboxylase N-terminal domain-containing protein [Variovorax sp. LG9.2]MEB0059658.1 Orn/Lys/Arg decarboxylase N-terminal domain-containing protein [Variovorax sp. LG9.2]